MSLLGPTGEEDLLASGTMRFLTIFFIFLAPPLFTIDDEAVPLTGNRFADVDAAAPPRVDKSWLLVFLLCSEDDRHGSRKTPRPLEDGDDDCAALAKTLLLSLIMPQFFIIETTAKR